MRWLEGGLEDGKREVLGVNESEDEARRRERFAAVVV